MNEQEFWAIIEGTKVGDLEQDGQETNLHSLLSELSLTEIVAFDRIFDELRQRSYSWDLWGAAYILNGGCSDDGFEYFQRALIAEGREKYERALADPESLVEWAEPDFEFEGIYYVASDVYKEKSGGEAMPRHNLEWTGPSGETWDEAELETRFPKLTERFG